MAAAVNGPLLVVLSGPSGVGKDSVIQRLKERGCPFHLAVTVTTRPRRPGEVEGRDYRFVSDLEYDAMLEGGELLEHATVYGHRYGVPRAPIREALAQGRDVILRIDVQGAATIRRAVPDAILIFLMPASLHELEERLRRRGANGGRDLKVRQGGALGEMGRVEDFDYVVVNPQGSLDEAARKVEAILTAENCRVEPRRVQV
jgi:guanylate kinase